MHRIGVTMKRWIVAKKARHDDDLDESSLTRSTAIGYGSTAPTVYLLQRFLWFPDYERFGFQGLRVANGGEDR